MIPRVMFSHCISPIPALHQTMVSPGGTIFATNLKTLLKVTENPDVFPNLVDALVARRNALLAQARRNYRPEGGLNHEGRLPQDWTY